MGIYTKIQNVRNELSKTNLRKTGYNKFTNFKYFELGDFLPKVTELCDKQKLCCVVNFNDVIATLSIYDDESNQVVEFTSPMVSLGTISDEGKHKMNEAQALGAVQTYIRRYLYMNAFEVVESDALDSLDTQNMTYSEENKQSQANKQLKQLEAFVGELNDGKTTIETMQEWIKKNYQGRTIELLSPKECRDLLENLRKAHDEKNK